MRRSTLSPRATRGLALIAVSVVALAAGVEAVGIVLARVDPHQFGIATGTLNFFRSLGGAIIVAAFAAIVLSGLDVAVPGGTLDKMANAGASASELAQKFRLVFVAAAFFLGLACIAVAVIEERPLGGPYVRAREPQ